MEVIKFNDFMKKGNIEALTEEEEMFYESCKHLLFAVTMVGIVAVSMALGAPVAIDAFLLLP